MIVLSYLSKTTFVFEACLFSCPIYNGQMLGENKNLKDFGLSKNISLKDTFAPISYNKTNKLIAALYMVTDILDHDEPMRGRLRSLGTSVISDIYSALFNKDILSRAVAKITEILSLLDIASMVDMISSMNSSILKKEFIKLRESIEEKEQGPPLFGGQVTMAEFMREDDTFLGSSAEYNKKSSIGHMQSTRIGIQKGHTLMQALSDRIPELSDRKHKMSIKPLGLNNNFELLKKERREEIIRLIKSNGSGATITDIKTKAQGSLYSSSEKTLQRELVSMVKDHVLEKTGEKRWSRYYLPK